MSGASAVMVVLVSGPDIETLGELGRTCVSERLAACVNVLGGVRSIYHWKGSVADDAEALAVFKTTPGRVEELEARVRELHPYEEPEFLALDVGTGSQSYMNWVVGCVTGLTDDGKSGGGEHE